MKSSSFKFTLTTLLGNMIEWYDFALYGYFATVIAKLFFPAQNESLSLLLTFGAFATGFIARPIGGILFGYVGDRFGRRMSLLVSIFLIMVPTSLIGCLPSYQSIGYFAPFLLTLCRIVQGVAVSGELTTSGIFLLESVPPKDKSFYASLIMASTYMGLLVGAITCVVISTVFDTTQLFAFGWRIPFLMSFFLGLAAIILRLQCQESPVFKAMQDKNELLVTPISEVMQHHRLSLLLIMLLSSLLAVVIYLLIGYFPSYFVMHLNMSLNQAMIVSAFGLFILTLSVPLVGKYVAQWGLNRTFMSGCLCFFLGAPGLFALLKVSAIACVILSALALSPIAATVIEIMAQAFPAAIRCTAVSIPYNFSMSLFGGTTPLIALSSTQYLHSEYGPALYLSVCACFSLVSICLLQKNSTLSGV